MHRCTLTLDADTYEAVKEQADDEGKSVEDFLSDMTTRAFTGEDEPAEADAEEEPDDEEAADEEGA